MRHVVRLSIVLALAATAALTQGPGARGDSPLGGDCGALAQSFAPWGDVASYYFPANGGFESGSAGWTLGGGGRVVKGNEPFYLHAADDSHALALPDGGSASVSVCYGVFYPALRFLVKGQGASVHVWVSTQNWLGAVSTLDGGTFTADAQWSPSPRISTLLSAAVSPFGAKSMQLHIDVSDGSALIDDLYVDPFVMRS